MKLSPRFYVWTFCLCLATNVRLLVRPNPPFEPTHLGLSFFVVMNQLVTPMFLISLLLTFTKETSNRIEKTILLLVLADYAMVLVRSLFRLGYLPFYVSPRLSQWLIFIATILLGYRMDQVLKDQEKKIEALTCSTPS
jgi:hypothetical protein